MTFIKSRSMLTTALSISLKTATALTLNQNAEIAPLVIFVKSIRNGRLMHDTKKNERTVGLLRLFEDGAGIVG